MNTAMNESAEGACPPRPLLEIVVEVHIIVIDMPGKIYLIYFCQSLLITWREFKQCY